MYIHSRDTPAANNTADALQVFCGYPLSGPYQVMPRVVIYPLVLIAIWSRPALMFVMLWTSVAAIHVCALAANHSNEVLDLDMFPATSATILGLGFAPLYIMHARGLKGSGRGNMFMACLWMVLLWTGMVTYVATTRFQPSSVACVDSHQHNITSMSMLSDCTFQCHNITTDLPMRLGQTAVLVAVPSSFFTGHGKTAGFIAIYSTAVFFFVILGSFWMAKQKDVWVTVRRIILARKKAKKTKSYLDVYCICVYKIAFLTFASLLWLSEDAFKHLPGTEKHDTIGQWGPLVAFALFLIGMLVRFIQWKSTDDEANSTKIKLKGAADDGRKNALQSQRDPEASHATDTGDTGGASNVASPENVHIRLDGRDSEPEGQALSRSSTAGE